MYTLCAGVGRKEEIACVYIVRRGGQEVGDSVCIHCAQGGQEVGDESRVYTLCTGVYTN